MRQHPLFGLALALFGALVLTPDAMLMRLSKMDGVQMMGWRGLCMGGVMITGWALLSNARRADLAAVTNRFGALIILCQCLNSALFSLGIANAPAAVVLIGVATVPVFSALLAWGVLGERARPATWLAIAAVMSGIGIAVFGDHSDEIGFDWAALLGAVAGLGVASVLALNFVVLRARPDLPIALLIGMGALCSGVIGTMLTGPSAMPDGQIWAMALTGAVVLPISFFSLSLAARYTPASNVSLLLLLETVLGPFWVWLAMDEAASPAMLLGGAIVVLSLAIYLLNERRLLLRQRHHAG
ncbi:DMT family transporter [Roseovarius pelagicus]|uniref:DMT family transporter n=1 Tax=Roseovarius pelagicus TaxID=2980108 RepID=A0ABY6D9J7_9RHOB|nr:DMT family transporter [Roseovarius pelagicus]UXX82814.1 DMT family transporter [Roseovarius pelagicus]